MSAAPPQMRRIPDEQFFDLRSWSADKAEDYGEKASMIVHTILLSKRDQVNRITSELHDGNIVLIDFTPLTSDQETLHNVLAELERAIADIDGDGDLDIFATSRLDDQVLLYTNDGSQNFAKSVIDYINELGEDLHFYVTLNGEEIK